MTRVTMGLLQVFIYVFIYPLTWISNAIARWQYFWRSKKRQVQPRTAFTTAVLQNDVAFARVALEGGLDPNTRLLDTPEFDPTGRQIAYLSLERRRLAPTALIIAASLGYIEMAETLLEFGADLFLKNGINTLGSNALHAAASAGRREMMALFLRHSGLDSIRGSDFETALISAAYGGNNAVITLLLENGANVNLQDDFDTPLTAAASSSHDATVTLLLEHGADVNLASSCGETPLMAAVDINRFATVSSDRLQVVNILIAAGAELNARDNDGRTALWWAKNSQLHALLKAAGATK